MTKEAQRICQTLQNKGFIAYFAGGGVRDFLLGQEPKDIDIATNATPDQIQEIFPDNVSIGKAFGVILVKSNSHHFEVATFRQEGPYKDKRRPDWVKFSTPQLDAERRDFTINGLFYDPITKKIIDYVDGQADIKKRVIRFIGKANDRISEDHLRLIRAIRFKSTLNFQYAPDTFEHISKLSNLITDVSFERICDEVNKIFKSSRRHIALAELSASGILKHILPEVEQLKGVPQPIEYHHEGDVFTHTYLALKSLPEKASLHLVWAVLLHDIAKPQTLIRKDGRIIFHDHAEVSAEVSKQILKRFKFSNLEIKTIAWLVSNHMKIAQVDDMRPVKKMAFLLDPRFPDLIDLVEADSKGTYPVNLNMVKSLEQSLLKAKEEKARMQELHKKTNLFNGDMLIKLGYNPSKIFSHIIEDVNDKLISGELSGLDQVQMYIEKNYPKP